MWGRSSADPNRTDPDWCSASAHRAVGIPGSVSVVRRVRTRSSGSALNSDLKRGPVCQYDETAVPGAVVSLHRGAEGRRCSPVLRRADHTVLSTPNRRSIRIAPPEIRSVRWGSSPPPPQDRTRAGCGRLGYACSDHRWGRGRDHGMGSAIDSASDLAAEGSESCSQSKPGNETRISKAPRSPCLVTV